MTEIHYDDLTDITTPWCLLDADTQARMRSEPEVLYLNYVGRWLDATNPVFGGNYTYRAKPKPMRVERRAEHVSEQQRSRIEELGAVIESAKHFLEMYPVYSDADCRVLIKKSLAELKGEKLCYVNLMSLVLQKLGA